MKSMCVHGSSRSYSGLIITIRVTPGEFLNSSISQRLVAMGANRTHTELGPANPKYCARVRSCHSPVCPALPPTLKGSKGA